MIRVPLRDYEGSFIGFVEIGLHIFDTIRESPTKLNFELDYRVSSSGTLEFILVNPNVKRPM